MATGRYRPPSAATVPTAGTPGDLAAKTGTAAGLYICTATNTYAQPLTPTGTPTTGSVTMFSGAASLANADATAVSAALDLLGT